MRTRKTVRTPRIIRAMMNFLNFLQMRKIKVFMGLMNQLKLVVGRLDGRQGSSCQKVIQPYIQLYISDTV